MFDRLISIIENRELFSENYFAERDIDELVDLRYSANFDRQWMRVYNDLKQTTPDAETTQTIDKIRELSFLMAYGMTESDDIAGLLSDDFELICKAHLAGYNDGWLNALICAYAAGQFPCGTLDPTDKDITACMQDWLG
ncbi:MAG: hypothetical protein E7559_06280 [Ruminococcaceae bacterium]|nr:hypothetical protein [Oscillospiraceae bacterium]